MTDKVLTAPPVIQRGLDGKLHLVVAGHPVEGVMQICSVFDGDGSYTTIVIHNSAVLFAVEKDNDEPAAH